MIATCEKRKGSHRRSPAPVTTVRRKTGSLQGARIRFAITAAKRERNRAAGNTTATMRMVVSRRMTERELWAKQLSD